MRLVYKFNIGKNENISSLCKISNNLYNQALYIFRETLSKEDKWLSYFELDAIMKNTKNLVKREVLNLICIIRIRVAR